jgi:hypothetical protein
VGITQFKIAYGATGHAPTVSTGLVGLYSIPLTWTTVSGATAYDVWQTVSSTRTFVTTTTSTSYTVTGLNASTAYTFEVYAKNAAGTVIASTLIAPLPALVKLTVWGYSQYVAGTFVNDGTLWFWPEASGSPQPGTFQNGVENLESDSVQSIDILFTSTTSASAPMLGVAANMGSTWVVDNTTYNLPSGGTNDTPTFIRSNPLTLPSLLTSGSAVTLQVCAGVGNTAFSIDFTNATSPSQPYGDIFQAGNALGTSIGGIDFGIPVNHIYGHLVSTATPRLLVAPFGDDTVAQYDPSTGKMEGIWFTANASARTASKMIRYYSFGQLSATWSTIQSRVLANLSLLNGRYGLVLVQVATYFSPFNNTGDAATAWSQYLTLKSTVEATGLKCRSLILSPTGLNNTTINKSEWAIMKGYVDAEAGIDVISSISSDGLTIDSANTSDGITLNATGSAAQGPALHTAIYSLAQSIGWSI